MAESKGFFDHYIIKVFPGDFFAILSGPLDHFGELVVGEVLPQLISGLFQVVERNGVGLVLVEEVEDLVDAVLGVLDKKATFSPSLDWMDSRKTSKPMSV